MVFCEVRGRRPTKRQLLRVPGPRSSPAFVPGAGTGQREPSGVPTDRQSWRTDARIKRESPVCYPTSDCAPRPVRSGAAGRTYDRHPVHHDARVPPRPAGPVTHASAAPGAGRGAALAPALPHPTSRRSGRCRRLPAPYASGAGTSPPPSGRAAVPELRPRSVRTSTALAAWRAHPQQNSGVPNPPNTTQCPAGHLGAFAETNGRPQPLPEVTGGRTTTTKAKKGCPHTVEKLNSRV